jgi:hypothetical protein
VSHSEAAGLRVRLAAVIAVAVIGSAALAGQNRAAGARFVTQVPWAGHGQWIRADTHIHTTFSDGSNTVAEVVAKARQYGCEAVAITDHSDIVLRAATPEAEAALDAARAASPGLIVVPGIEWNVPPFGGDEHASILFPDGPSTTGILAEFKQRFDDLERKDGVTRRADEALAWLARNTASLPAKPVVVYNHPTRKRQSSLSSAADIAAWHAASDLVVAIEGGPGHQQFTPLGTYTAAEPVIDRWDPVVARTGDVWDRLLQDGVDLHGAVASSDFHNAKPTDLNDYWPCQFAETWYYVPQRTVAGVLAAIRSGTFFGVHGHIAREVQLTVTAPGLSRPAVTGESIRVPAGAAVTVAVTLTVPPTDWSAAPNHVDDVEIIVVRKTGVEVRTRAIVGAGVQSISEPLDVGDDDVVIRARGRRVVADGPDLMFYTNAIRIRAGA